MVIACQSTIVAASGFQYKFQIYMQVLLINDWLALKKRSKKDVCFGAKFNSRQGFKAEAQKHGVLVEAAVEALFKF